MENEVKNCVMCGCVASPEPEYQEYCPNCVELTWDVSRTLFGKTDLQDDWENVCFPLPPETFDQQRDRVLKKMIGGLPEMMEKLESTPGVEVKLSWVNPQKPKPKAL